MEQGADGEGRRWAALVRGNEAVELIAIVEPAEAARHSAVANLALAPGNYLISLDEALDRTEAAITAAPGRWSWGSMHSTSTQRHVKVHSFRRADGLAPKMR